jgi:hypothetical protein
MESCHFGTERNTTEKPRADEYRLLSLVVHCARIRINSAPVPMPRLRKTWTASPVPVALARTTAAPSIATLPAKNPTKTDSMASLGDRAQRVTSGATTAPTMNVPATSDVANPIVMGPADGSAASRWPSECSLNTAPRETASSPSSNGTATRLSVSMARYPSTAVDVMRTPPIRDRSHGSTSRSHTLWIRAAALDPKNPA